MGLIVTTGAIMRCSFGVAPCPIQAMGNQTVIAKTPVATMQDTSPASVMTFGMCQSMANPTVAGATAAALGVLTPMPCIPVIATPWIVSNPVVQIKGSPVLTMDAKAMCSYGGSIAFVSGIAGTVNVK